MKNDEENKNARLRLVRLYTQAADATEQHQHQGLKPFAKDPTTAFDLVKPEDYAAVEHGLKRYLKGLDTLAGLACNHPAAELVLAALCNLQDNLTACGVGASIVKTPTSPQWHLIAAPGDRGWLRSYAMEVSNGVVLLTMNNMGLSQLFVPGATLADFGVQS